jgi:hypothetical protein
MPDPGSRANCKTGYAHGQENSQALPKMVQKMRSAAQFSEPMHAGGWGTDVHLLQAVLTNATQSRSGAMAAFCL